MLSTIDHMTELRKFDVSLPSGYATEWPRRMGRDHELVESQFCHWNYPKQPKYDALFTTALESALPLRSN